MCVAVFASALSASLLPLFFCAVRSYIAIAHDRMSSRSSSPPELRDIRDMLPAKDREFAERHTRMFAPGSVLVSARYGGGAAYGGPPGGVSGTSRAVIATAVGVGVAALLIYVVYRIVKPSPTPAPPQ